MEYSEGRPGRVWFLRVDHGEDLRSAILSFAREHAIAHATVQVLGALGDARLVSGPEAPEVPPIPHWERATGGWDSIGLGTLHPGEDGPVLHLHAALGHGREVLAGCIREEPRVYLVAEVVITEVLGVVCPVIPDPRLGVSLPFPGKGTE